MKQAVLFFPLTIGILFFSCSSNSADSKQTVNPLLGDISFVNKFGYQPGATTDNEVRIKTHLEYVETLLRNKNISSFSINIKEKRNKLLGLLHKYWTAGVFPKNYDYAAQRKPCFIDKDGRICAVGYLIEQTTSKQVADEINSKHKYDELLAMNDKTVDSWIGTSGLTKEECAMIQPTYGPVYGYPSNQATNNITAAYGISSAVLGGLNLSLNTINAIQIAKGTNSKVLPVAGLITGLGQMTVGVAMFSKKQNVDGYNYSNESQKTLSMINIGLGTATMLVSAWNLITNRKPTNKPTTWNIYSYPAQNNNTVFAFSLTRKF